MGTRYRRLTGRQALAAFAILLVSAVVAGPASGAAPGLHNVGAASAISHTSLDGGLVAFTVSEVEQGGADLNGDGDAVDPNVVHLFDTSSNQLTNLGVASFFGSFAQGESILAVEVYEPDQGADLNGDGQLDDTVLHVYDADTGQLVDLGLDAALGLRVDAPLVAFRAEEAADGDDRNGDGDAFDAVLHVYDAANGVLTNVGVAAQSAEIHGSSVAFGAWEDRQGTDLNGDGDTSDFVLHVYDASTGVTTNVGVAVGEHPNLSVFGSRVAFQVPEVEQGAADLNGDGDASDAVIHLYNSTTAALTNLGLATGGQYVLRGTILALLSWELAQGSSDLNGDGDQFDFVVHIYDVSAATMTNLGVASQFDLVGDGGVFVSAVEEAAQDADLNGDGDEGDRVPHVYKVSDGSFTNLGVAASPFFQLSGTRLLVHVDEARHGSSDLNGDGDANDHVMHLYDASSGILTNTGAGCGGVLAGPKILCTVDESKDGTFLNGDLDSSDDVVHRYDIETGTFRNLGVALVSDGGLDFDGASSDFMVSETGGRTTDLNGDADTTDEHVLFVYDASQPPPPADADGDGLTDDQETALGTNPDHPDSDGDRLTDDEEVALGADPLNPDTDGDGIPDGEEVELGTSPTDADTDDDGIPDPLEPAVVIERLFGDLEDAGGPLVGTVLDTVGNPFCEGGPYC